MGSKQPAWCHPYVRMRFYHEHGDLERLCCAARDRERVPLMNETQKKSTSILIIISHIMGRARESSKLDLI